MVGAMVASNLPTLAGQRLRDVALQHLPHQIEGIQEFADLDDPAIAQCVKVGKIELHHPLVGALAEENAEQRRDLVALGEDRPHLVARAGIATSS